MSTLRILAYILLGLLIGPLILVFFTPVITPYILVHKVRNPCLKVLMALLGLILGLMLIPFFVIAAIFYAMALIAVSLADCCAFSCDCFSLNGGAAVQMHRVRTHSYKPSKNQVNEF